MVIELLQEKHERKKNILAEKEGKVLLRRPRPQKSSPLDEHDYIPMTPPSMAGLSKLFSPTVSQNSNVLLCDDCTSENNDADKQQNLGAHTVADAIKIPKQTLQCSETAMTECSSPYMPTQRMNPASREGLTENTPCQTPASEYAQQILPNKHRTHIPGSYLQPVMKTDLIYVLDPNYSTNQRSIPPCTGVPGLLLRPSQPRGPDPFPQRETMHMEDEVPEFMQVIEDDRYATVPEFQLENFLRSYSKSNNVPMEVMHDVFYSRHNYEQLTKLLGEDIIPRHEQVNFMEFTLSEEELPTFKNKVPQQQLLLEMVRMVKQHVSSHIGSTRTVVKPLPKYTPGLRPGPHTEIIVYTDEVKDMDQDDSGSESTPASAMSTRGGLTSAHLGAINDGDTHPAPRHGYHHGAQRSTSPFMAETRDLAISSTEVAILESMAGGGKTLDAKAYFISELPDISHMYTTLVYLNLSFNNFTKIPSAVMKCGGLEGLSLRNNPISSLPNNIHKLKRLKELVLSFGLISDVNDSLCRLQKLEVLDLRYNNLKVLPNSIGNLRTLRELNLEGNQLEALPSGATRLKLTGLNVKNNFMSPILWKDNMTNDPQNLCDMAALGVVHFDLVNLSDNVPSAVMSILDREEVCDCCGGPRFGSGLRVIRPVPRLFGTVNLPFVFHSCGVTCLSRFMTLNNSLRDILYG